MKNNKGFLLLQELMCLCLAAILLTITVSSLYRASATVQQSRQLAECAMAAQQAAAGEAYCGRVMLTQSKMQQQGLAILEVQADYGRVEYTLIQAQAATAGVSVAGVGTGVYGDTADAGAGL